MEAGEEIEVFKDNRPVAKIVPLSRRQRWLPAAEIGRIRWTRPGHHRPRGGAGHHPDRVTDDLPW